MKIHPAVFLSFLTFLVSTRTFAGQDYYHYDDFSESTINDELWTAYNGVHISNGSLIMNTAYSMIDTKKMHINGMKASASVNTAVNNIGDHVNFHMATKSPSGKTYLVGLYHAISEGDPPLVQEYVFCQILNEVHIDLFNAQWGTVYEFGLEYTDWGRILVIVNGSVVYSFALPNGNEGFYYGAKYWFRSSVVESGGGIVSEIFGVTARDGCNPTITFLDPDNSMPQVKGAVADGASEVVIRVDDLPLNTTVKMFLPEDSFDGSFINQQGTEVYYVEGIADADGVFEQKYRAPGNFAYKFLGTREIALNVFLNNGGKDVELSHNPFNLYKTPVVLLHGLWSDPLTWSTLRSKLKNEYHYPEWSLEAWSYKKTNAAHFNRNRDEIRKAINHVLNNAKNQHIVAKKVDVVAHSMGGILAKKYGSESTIRTITTVGTPHYGSPLADLLWSMVDDPFNSVEYAVAYWLQKSGHAARDGAIEDLRMDHICDANQVDVPNQVIVGLSPLTESTTVSFINLLANIAKFYGILPFFANVLNLNQLIFGSEENDWIVSRSSQEGGSSGITDPVTWHVGETKDPEVMQKIIDFLHDPVTYANASAAACIAQKQSRLETTFSAPDFGMALSAGDVQIVSPADGATFNSGDQVLVQVQVSQSDTLVLVATSTGNSTLIDSAPYEFEFTIPGETAGAVTIMVGARDEFGFIGSQEVDINVTLSGTLIDMEVLPETEYSSVDLYVGDQSSIMVSGIFDDGIIRNITSANTGTLYISQNSLVLEVSPDGIVTGIAPGEAQVEVSNSGLFSYVSFVINPDTHRPAGDFGRQQQIGRRRPVSR